MEPVINVHVELPEELAWALAQWLKRAGYAHYRALAESDAQAYQMRDAADQLRQALAGVGVAPR